MDARGAATSALCIVRSKQTNSVLDVVQMEQKYGGHYAAACPEWRSGGMEQLWLVVEKGNEDIMLISAETQNALEEWQGEDEWVYNGYYVGTSPPHGGATQLWRIEGDKNKCVLRNRATGYVLDLFLGDDWLLGHGVGTCPSWGGRNQTWAVEPVFHHEVVSVEYKVDEKAILESTPKVLFSFECTNATDEPSTTVVEHDVRDTNKHHWQFNWDPTHKFFWKLATELTMPPPATIEVVAESPGGAHTIAVGSDSGRSSSASVNFSLNDRVQVQAKSSKCVTLSGSMIKLEIPFVAKLKIKNMHTGESEVAEVTGKWQGALLHAFRSETSAAKLLRD